ncbi:MAG: hypothetical protein IJT23_01955 [Clostridia bacterium]|nr:hypothetical protein [Clostridia bacterium]
MDEQFFKEIWKRCKQLEGKSVFVGNALSNVKFIEQSRKEASKYEWLYHCTNSSAFFSILRNQEFWLTNLKLVNDEEEVARIDVPEYEKSYYVTCFTYDNNISQEHWEEYGNMSDGILIGVKRQWFSKNACFMDGQNKKTDDDFFEIYRSREDALQAKIKEQERNRIINPFYINEFSFYKIIYDDNLRKNIKGISSIELNKCIYQGETLTPPVAGIIKSTHGFEVNPKV